MIVICRVSFQLTFWPLALVVELCLLFNVITGRF